MTERRIFNITFEADSMVIAYMDKDDVRVRGHVAQQRSLLISTAHQDYREEYLRLQAHAERVLVDVLEDFEDSEPHEEETEDEYEGKGMGDH